MPGILRRSRIAVIVIAAIMGFVHDARAGEPARPARALDRSQITELGRMIRFDPSFKVRTAAARKLGDLADRGARGDPDVVRALIDALGDSDHIVRGVAAHGLGRHASPDAVRALEIAQAKDAHAFVREAAARAVATATKTNVEPVVAAVARAKDRPRRVEVGRIAVSSAEMKEKISDTIDELLGSRKPAMFPREDADARIDVEVSREGAAPSTVSYRVKVVIIELPAGTLRHAANATATAAATRASAKKMAELEKKVALEATTRAVSDVLELYDRS